MMKIPSEETQEIHHNEGDGYLSDDYEQIEMIPPPIRDGDFSEYMWMENEEEFNSQVLRELEEQELMEECIAANEEYVTHPVMNNLTDSVNNLLLSSNGVRNSNGSSDSFSNPQNSSSPANQSSRATAQSRLDRIRCPPQLSQSPSHSQAEKESSLNPEAKEFVPTSRPTAPSSEDENEKLPS